MPSRRKPKLRQDFTIDELKALLAFVEAGGVSAAADLLGTTQPTLSRKLQVFQRPNRDGRRILERVGKRLRLTDIGKGALGAVRDLVGRFDQLDRYCYGRNPTAEVVRLGIGSFAAEHYLPGLLSELRVGSRDWRIEVEAARGQERILGVIDGRFHLAIVTHDPLQIQTMVSVHVKPKTDLTVKPLSRQHFCVAAKKGTAAARQLSGIAIGRTVPIELIPNWELVGLDRQSGLRRLLERHFAGKGTQLQFIEEACAGGWPAAREFARSGIGVALLPLATLRRDDLREFVLRRLSDRFTMTDYIIHRADDVAPASERLKQLLNRTVAAQSKRVGEQWTGAI